MTEKKRTLKQNNSIHMYCSLVAEALNKAGWSVQKVLSEKSKVDIDWNTLKVKEIIWKEIQEAILKKKSTTQLNKQIEIDKVYDHINRWLTNPNNPMIEEPIPFPSETEINHHNDAVNMSNKLKANIDYPQSHGEPIF
jgi:hypothetical protein